MGESLGEECVCSHHNQVLLPDASVCSLDNRGGVAVMMMMMMMGWGWRGGVVVGLGGLNVVTTE